ncbi:MAG: c-type cytochrome, partial [Vulcanimicrobiaceae bacterium]
MKSLKPPSPRERPIRLIVTGCAVMLLAAYGWLAPARAADAEHWLTPSLHRVDPATLFESGIPNASATVAPVTAAQQTADGAVLYGVHCSSCHGADLNGSTNVPSLLHAGGSAVDFY